MATTGGGKPRCPDTGLAVPECSCKRCLEAMLREFQPALLAGDIRITRVGGHREPPRRRRAA